MGWFINAQPVSKQLPEDIIAAIADAAKSIKGLVDTESYHSK